LKTSDGLVLGRGLDVVIANKCEPEYFSPAEMKKVKSAVRSGSVPAKAAGLAEAVSERAIEQAELLETLEDGVSCQVLHLDSEPAGIRPRDLVSKLAGDLVAASDPTT
jgi:hypothetical protein